MRKPVYAIDLRIRSFYIWNFQPLASFCCCAGQFESYLVTNPEDMFCREEAQMDIHAEEHSNCWKHSLRRWIEV